MASVALAGPPRVNDKLQTCPTTVYKSGLGTLVDRDSEVAFFCQTPDASLDQGVGLSRDISDPATHHFAERNGFREYFSNTQCLVCIRVRVPGRVGAGRVLEISFDLSCESQLPLVLIVNKQILPHTHALQHEKTQKNVENSSDRTVARNGRMTTRSCGRTASDHSTSSLRTLKPQSHLPCARLVGVRPAQARRARELPKPAEYVRGR